MKSHARSLVPALAKRALIRGVEGYRLATSRLRTTPDFIIVGAQRCGTTSLYRYLIGHPSVVPASKKEVHFFDFNYEKGLGWYRSHFPLRAYKYYRKTIHGKSLLTGEASPYYLFHPQALRRIAETFPAIKLIAILRNPIDRAYSHYQHEVRRGHETLSFEEAIDRERQRLQGELDGMLAEESSCSFAHQHYSYLSRGIYATQLCELRRAGFSDEQVLALQAEEFFGAAEHHFKRLLEFLGLPEWQPEKFEPFNLLDYEEMGGGMRERLRLFFEPHNQKLYELLGRDFGWR